MVLFPIYFIAAGIRSSVGRSAWLFGSALLLALNIICFVNHYWAADAACARRKRLWKSVI